MHLEKESQGRLRIQEGSNKIKTSNKKFIIKGGDLHSHGDTAG
jgi:hypothetical protein